MISYDGQAAWSKPFEPYSLHDELGDFRVISSMNLRLRQGRHQHVLKWFLRQLVLVTSNNNHGRKIDHRLKLSNGASEMRKLGHMSNFLPPYWPNFGHKQRVMDHSKNELRLYRWEGPVCDRKVTSHLIL